jgi:pimeloyl-ACP methyl ester carboxylesterase
VRLARPLEAGHGRRTPAERIRELIVETNKAKAVPTDDHLGVFDPPANLIAGSDGRLIQPLRDAARTRDPTQIIALAASAYHKATREPSTAEKEAKRVFAQALADLAVTGRVAYEALQNGLDTTALKDATRQRLNAESVAATNGEIQSAINKALDRVYAVAWALRGPAAQRAELREPLGWIAVSAEDDTPHRPVNMPDPRWEQYEIPVTVGGVTLATRFFLASAEEPTIARVPPQQRQLPPDPTPTIPVDHEVLIFLHGHSSGAEEALDITPRIHAEGLARGKKYTVVSLDLPNNGYSETFDHTLIAPTSATTYPKLPTDRGPIKVPVLDFIEDFAVAFALKLRSVTGFQKQKFAGWFGGSLGGNLGLRLGRRDLSAEPWLGNAIAAWSPAGVWMPKVQHFVDYRAPKRALDKCAEPETVGSRADYFKQVYDKWLLFPIIKPQPEYWYRDDWELKDFYVEMSRVARREIYNANYRQWHWRVAGEQLLFSHFDRVTHDDNTTPLRFELNTVRTLLAAGEVDNYFGTKIYDNTAKLARLMVNAEGRLLLVANSGHSIHTEHPQFFAREIVNFLNE